MAIGDRIKRSREFKKITQEELADRLGVQRNTIWRWENEKAFPTKPIVEIAQALSVSTLYLLGETENPDQKEFARIIDGESTTSYPINMNAVCKKLGIKQPQNHSADNDLDETDEPGRSASNVANSNISAVRRPEIESNLRPLNPHHRTVVRVLPKDFAACCGDGVNWETNTVGFEYEYIDPDPDLTRFSPVIAMHVIGDSMEPDIEEGDMVLFTENSSDVEYASNGSIAVVNYDGRMIVRGLFKRNDRIVLKAWNKDYDDIELTPDDEFRVCGIVLRVDKSKRPRSML